MWDLIKSGDTAEFACETICRWWKKMGAHHYTNATDLLIMADGGGSNGSRLRLWKVALQKFANETQMNISVCHFPPGSFMVNGITGYIHKGVNFVQVNCAQFHSVQDAI